MITTYEYMIRTSQAKMPSSMQYGGNDYYRIGLIEYDPTIGYPRQISDRARCVQSVRTWERLYRGPSNRCAYARALADAERRREVMERRQTMRVLALRAGMTDVPAALLPGDYLACRKSGRRAVVVTRYAADWTRTGYAIPMPADLVARYGRWEHGITVAACRAEIATKRAVVAADAAKARAAKRDARRVHLAAVMCARLTVSYQHARRAGLCDAGIRAYCRAHGLDVETGAPAGVLRATGDPLALRAITVAARDAIESRFRTADRPPSTST
jgi:hypothetical protein